MNARPIDQLNDFVLSTGAADVPSSVKEMAKVFLLDTLTVGLSGATEPIAQNARDASINFGHGEIARPLGCRVKRPVGTAAFISAFHIHCQEWDCVHEPAVVHAMSVVTAALAAWGQHVSLSGEDFLLGLTLGVEYAARLGMASEGEMQFFRPATAGLMGAAASLARLSGAQGDEYKDRVGLAFSQVSGSMQSHLEGGATMALQVGLAARSAVTANDFGSAGFTGPHDVIEGPFGFLRLIEKAYDANQLTAGLGHTFAIAQLSHKPYPSGRASHGALEVLKKLVVDAGIPPSQIASISLSAPRLIHRLVSRPSHPGMSTNYARLSLPYLAWRLIFDGELSGESFTQEKLSESDVLARGGDFSLIVNDVSDPNALGPQAIEVRLRDGQVLRQVITDMLGSPLRPLNQGQQREKAEACLLALDPETRASAVRDIEAQVQNLEAMEEVSTLIESLPQFTD